MIALLIIATSFVVLLHSRNQSVIAADYARHMTVATLLASEKMSELEQSGATEISEEAGEFGEEFPEYTWRTTITDTAYEKIKEVRIEVLWGISESPSRVELVNYVKEKE